GKKDLAVFGLPLGDAAKHTLYRFPAALGEPRAALWAGEEFGGVVVERGVVWFNGQEGKFLPLLLTQPPVVGAVAGDDHSFWFVVPHSKQAAKSVLVSLGMPLEDVEGYQSSFTSNQPLRAVRIDASGLSK
ncbi:MAG: hypothetical protein J0I06_03665, partial [Planctomycetes bacterium]|nr:hypothetical protein [Planctomycetota bacterium]